MNCETPDTEAAARGYATGWNAWVLKLRTLSLAELTEFSFPDLDGSKLSEKSREIVTKELFVGLSAWSKGYARSATHRGQAQAALELLALEKSGVALTAEVAARVTRDPVSGVPFAFDAARRELALPVAAAADPPLKLPW